MPKAILISNENKEYKSEITNINLPNLNKGELRIKTSFSSINYKDALAITGKGKIIRSFPLVPGIDVCGQVLETNSDKFQVGDKVFQTGGDLGELYNGGLSEQTILNEKNCLPLPENLSEQEVITLGTAGFTAGLAIYKMELNGLSKNYPILVTGSTGGVGSFAVQILNQKHYTVTAMTGKPDSHAWLKELGAKNIISPDIYNQAKRALESVKWSGCIDNVGGELLSKVISEVDIYGQVASVGLAGGVKFDSTVMPYILRGVNLLGVSSNNCPMMLRKKVWTVLSEEYKPKFISPSHIIKLDEVNEYSEKLLGREIKGRIIVKF